jgi:hypothetical protein
MKIRTSPVYRKLRKTDGQQSVWLAPFEPLATSIIACVEERRKARNSLPGNPS